MTVRPGVFISCEGGEGVGKSTFLNGLAKRLEDKGKKILQTREPGGSPAAEAIRKLFISPPKNEALDIHSEYLLVAAARRQHLCHTIIPALKAGIWVLCDRFFDSSLVYQGALGGLDRAWMESVYAQTHQGYVPDLTFLLDCTVELSLQRIKNRSDPSSRFDLIEKTKHEQIRQTFLDLSKEMKQRYRVLDAQKSSDEMVAEACKHIEKAFVKS